MAKALLVYAGTTASANNTFIGPAGTGVGQATELDVAYAASMATQFTNLRRHISSGGSGTNELIFRKNAAAGDLLVSGGAGGGYDTLNTDNLVSGDLFNFALTSDGTDPVYRWLTLNAELSPTHGCYHRATGVSGPVNMTVAGATRFQPINGVLITDGTATIANSQWTNRGYSSVDAFQIRITANTRADDTTVTLRVAGSTVAASSITIPSGVTGLFLVTGIGQALADGDTINAAVALGAGAGTLTVGHIGATLLSTGLSCEAWLNIPSAVARAASATATYYIPAGTGAASTTRSDNEIIPGFAADLKNLRIRLIANTYSTNATLTVFVNGMATALTQTITAGATGLIENSTDKVTIGPTDTVTMEIVGGGTGSISLTAMGFLLAKPTPTSPSETTKPRFGRGRGVGPKLRNHPWPEFFNVG